MADTTAFHVATYNDGKYEPMLPSYVRNLAPTPPQQQQGVSPNVANDTSATAAKPFKYRRKVGGENVQV